MQELWASLLAGEANQPGSVSERTVDFVAAMDKIDAETFARLCRFSANSLDETLIFDRSHQKNVSGDNSYLTALSLRQQAFGPIPLHRHPLRCGCLEWSTDTADARFLEVGCFHDFQAIVLVSRFLFQNGIRRKKDPNAPSEPFDKRTRFQGTVGCCVSRCRHLPIAMINRQRIGGLRHSPMNSPRDEFAQGKPTDFDRKGRP